MSCPDENELQRFSSGRTPPDALGALEGHLDGCDRCRAVVAQLVSVAGAEAPLFGSATLPVGTALGRYRLERVLGAGGMGVVYAAIDSTLDRTVALKVLHARGPDADGRARLQREAQAMARLSHPGVVPVFELGREAGQDFLTMELVDGPTLDRWLLEAPRSPTQILRVLLDAGRGLAAAHRAGVVHRDFKPGNVLIGSDGRARVTDFGLARPHAGGAGKAGPMALTQEGTLLGTPAYMAPEQLAGELADARSDQFSFCVCLVEALTGARPFQGRTVDALRAQLAQPAQLSGLSSDVRKAVSRGLSLDPGMRFEGMDALLDALERSPRRSGGLWAAGLAALLLLGGAAWSLRPSSRPVQVPQQSLELTVGQTRILEVPGLSRVALGSTEIADVRVENGGIAVSGVSPGRTTLMVWVNDQRREWDVKVTR